MKSNRSAWARSTVDLVLARQPARQDRHHAGETGLVTTERVARLCGDHSEHAYDVLRCTTHGTACVSVCYHLEVANTLICSTAVNSIAQYDTSRSACISYQPKGPKRCSNAFNPSLTHVAVYGDPVVPAIELQLCYCSKFTWLEGHTAEVRCCSLSQDGSIVISGGRDGQAYLWLVTQPGGPTADPAVKRFTLPGHGSLSQVKACCISADSCWAATASTDGQVLVWDLTGIQPQGRKTSSSAAPTSAGTPSECWTKDAATAAASSSVQLAAVYTLPRDRTGDYATVLGLSADGSWLAVGSRTGKVFLAAANKQQLSLLPLRHQDGSKVRCCSFAPDGSKLATVGDDGRMVLWDVGSSSWVLTVHEHSKPVRGCCWSPDGRKIVTAGMDTLICVIDLVLLTTHHKLRMPLRLSGGSATAETHGKDVLQGAAVVTGAVSSPKAAAGSTAYQQHPLLTKAAAPDEDSKLLACVPVVQQHRRLRSHQSAILSGLSASAEGEESVLCADQAGRILVLHPHSATATATDLSIGSSIYCCCFDGTVVAAAKRDGAVTALSCSAAVMRKSSGDGVPTLEAQWDPPVAVSAKLNMLVNGVSMCSQLGRVALVGTEKKVHQTGVLWLWEYDPSVRPFDLSGGTEGDDAQGFSGFDGLLDRLGSRGSGMLSSGESRIPSVASPRGISDTITLDDSEGNKSTLQYNDRGQDSKSKGDQPQPSGYGCGTPAAAAIGPDGWLWRCENPVKVLTVADTPLQCCAFAKGESAKLVVGTSAGWLSVVNLAGEEMEDNWTRYQIHSCEVSAVDFAADGDTIVSGGADGRVVMWSQVTGFKLAVWTLHSAAIRTLAFNTERTMVAVGDAAGVVSSWDVVQSCLITAAHSHEGPATSVSWMSSNSSSSGNSSVVSCGYDGTIAMLQIDPGIYKLYRAAFRGLYHSCKRSHKVHKLEMAINWHLTQGALQDASVLQLLVNTAAADGNVTVLSLLLPLFDRMGWLSQAGRQQWHLPFTPAAPSQLHFGPVFTSSPPPTLKRIESDKSMGLARKSIFSLAHGAEAAAAAAADLSEYTIHPHDRVVNNANGSKGYSRRGTKESLNRDKQAGKNPRLESFAVPGAAGDRAADSSRQGSRWTRSVADISRLLAFQGQQQCPSQHQQHLGGVTTAAGGVGALSDAAAIGLGLPAAAVLAPPKHRRSSSAGGSAGDAACTPESVVAAAAVSAGGLSSGLEDSCESGANSPTAYDSSEAATSPNITPHHTPTKLLSPINSRNARTPAVLPSLDTLHEESHINLSNTHSADAEEKLLPVRTRGPDPASSDLSSNAPASPHVGVAITADEDVSDALSTSSSMPGQSLQAAGHSNGGHSGGGASAAGSPLQGNSSPRSSRGGPATPFAQQENSSILQRMGANLPPMPLHNHTHQQQQVRPTMGRQLLSFLSGKRTAISFKGFADAAHSDSGGPADAAGLTGRQRSLSEGASLAQRLTAYRSINLSSRDIASNIPPGNSRENLRAPGSHIMPVGTGPPAAPYSGTAGSGFASIVAAASAAAAQQQQSGNSARWGTFADTLNHTNSEKAATLSAQNSRRRTLQDFLHVFTMSRHSRQVSGKSVSSAGAGPSETEAGKDLLNAQSGFSAASGGSKLGDGLLGASGRKLAQLFSGDNWARNSKTSQALPLPSALKPQQQPSAKPNKDRAQQNRDDLLQAAMASQQAQCVRLVVDTLLAGRFSKVSVVQHMYDALQALIHDAQHKRACRRLLKHLPMIDNGEVEVDSLLTHNTKILYKCATTGHPGNLWASATSSQQPLIDALDVLMKRASWRDSIAALIMWPVLWSLKHLGAAWLWLWARQGLGSRHRVQVSATSKLVPVAHAAEIRAGSRGNLLRQLVSANVDADLYGKELVRAIINVKWDSFARAFLLMQGVQFFAFLVLFLAYLFVAVYGSDPQWNTAQMLASSQGQAAVVLECILMLMMFGQAADEGKQIVTYGREYFNSPWNYMDVASCVTIGILFLLHISRLNHQLFVILVALEVLLLCLRSLYFCMALDQIGALLRMVLIVIKDMRFFFMMLVFLLISFGLTFSVLMSPASKTRLNIISTVASNQIVDTAEVQVFGSLEDSMTQLFTIMFGDVQFSTLKTIMNVNTVASRLAVVLACVYAVLVLIVLVNLLIAIVDETYGTVKENEADQMLRNKALIIDEIESTLTDAVVKDLNGRVLLPYVHILIPQAARADQHHRRRDLHAKFRKLKHFLKERLPDPSLPGSYSADSGLTSMTSACTAVTAAGAGSSTWHQQQQQQAQRRMSTSVAPSKEQQQQQQSGAVAGAVRGEASAGAAAATVKVQQEVSQLSHSVSALGHKLEAVNSSNTAAVAELATKVEAMQGDISQIKDLLTALVARQQG